MKKNKTALFFLLLSLLFSSPSLAQDLPNLGLPDSNAKNQDYREGEVIVKYKEKSIDLEQTHGRLKAKALSAAKGLTSAGQIKEKNLELLKSDQQSTQELIAQLKNDSRVETVQPNYLKNLTATTNDTSYNLQWALHNTGQSVLGKTGTADADIDCPEGWDVEATALTNDTIVAVIDTGVRYDHQDLAANMWDGTSCKDDQNLDVLGGCPNHGWDYKGFGEGADDNDPMDEDPPASGADEDWSGHGTHVSGIIGAVSNNATGVSGISRQNHLKIMALRFGFDTFSEVKAINFAKYNGAKVINASFSGSSFDALEKEAIDGFGGLFVAAASNGGADNLGDNNDTAPQYPCSYLSSNIICVAATDQDDKLTSFSNYGATSVDVAAPGEYILSSYKTSTSSYAYMSGTSMATPVVAGLAGMAYGMNPAINQALAKNIILTSGDYLSSLAGKLFSPRRVNLNGLLQMFSDSTAPVRSSGSPTSALSAGTTSTTLSLATNEAATCRYSTSAGTNYAAMTTFTTTGNLSHSATISSLANGTSYSYYVKCIDTMSNTNAEDYTISFSVAAPAPAPTPTPTPQPTSSSSTNSTNNNPYNLSPGQHTVQNLNTRGFLLAWATPTSGTSNVRYGMKRKKLRAQASATSDNGVFSIDFTNLKKKKTYYFQIINPDGSLGQQLRVKIPRK